MPRARFHRFHPQCMPRRIRAMSASARLMIAIGCAGSTPAAAAPADPSGLWLTKGGGSIIKIAPCGTFYCGALVWLKNPNDAGGKPKTDRLNEDARKRGRPMTGIDILLNLAPETDHWRGQAYNPEDGKTYDITFKLVTDKMAGDKAEIEGCVLKFLCKTDSLTRTQTIPKNGPVQP